MSVILGQVLLPKLYRQCSNNSNHILHHSLHRAQLHHNSNHNIQLGVFGRLDLLSAVEAFAPEADHLDFLLPQLLRKFLIHVRLSKLLLLL